MSNFWTDNLFFGPVLTLAFYVAAQLLYRKTRHTLLNPFLVSLSGITAFLLLGNVPVAHYAAGTEYLLALLPFTIILLALPLFRQLPLLAAHKFAILAGVGAGVVTSALSVFCLSRLLGVDEALIRSLLPKSITTPMGLILSEALEGIASVTVISIVVTGVMGVVIYGPVFKLFRVTHPVAQGIAFGTTSHAIGTSKAMELGEVSGAMSGLAIVLAGVVTVAATPLFLLIFSLI